MSGAERLRLAVLSCALGVLFVWKVLVSIVFSAIPFTFQRSCKKELGALGKLTLKIVSWKSGQWL